MSKRATLVDVAREARVSLSTASRALNGGIVVRPELDARVRLAAENLGYRINPQARSLRTGTDTAIGLVVEDFNVVFFARIAAGVDAAANQRGVNVVIGTSGTGGSERHGVEALASRNVAGMIVTEGQAGEEYLAGIGRSRPVVVVDAARPHPTLDTVTVDNHGGGRAATQWLLDRGHRTVAFVGSSPTAKTVHRRYEGYLDAMTTAGLQPREEHIIWAGLLIPEARAALEQAVPGWTDVTAAFTAVARTTPGLVSALASTGRRDIDVMAFDDMEMGDALEPPLSALEQDAAAIGKHAARLLFERIDGYDGPPRHVQVPLTLVDRSQAPPPGGAVPTPRTTVARTSRRPE